MFISVIITNETIAAFIVSHTPQDYLRYHFLVVVFVSLQLMFDVKSKPTESPKNFTGLHQPIVTTQILSGLGVRHLVAFSPVESCT